MHDLLRDLRSENRERIVIEGAVAVERAVAAGVPIACAAGLKEQLDRVPFPPTAELTVLSRTELDALVGFPFHRGLVAAVRRLHWTHRPWRPPAGGALALALVGLADPANLGAIVRSAAAFGVDVIFVDENGADPFARRATRAAMAANFCLPIETFRSGELVAMLRSRIPDVELLALSAKGDVDLARLVPASSTVLLLGNEGAGLPVEIMQRADRRVRIATPGRVASLNVAACAAIALHHCARLLP